MFAFNDKKILSHAIPFHPIRQVMPSAIRVISIGCVTYIPKYLIIGFLHNTFREVGVSDIDVFWKFEI